MQGFWDWQRDVLFEAAHRKELYRRYKAAKNRLKTLRRAVEDGEPLAEACEAAKRDVVEARSRLPQAAHVSFCALCLWTGWTIWVPARAYPFIREFATGMWGTPEHWYLLEYRAGAAWVWRAMEAVTWSPWLAVMPAGILVIVWCVQRHMHRRLARARSSQRWQGLSSLLRQLLSSAWSASSCVRSP